MTPYAWPLVAALIAMLAFVLAWRFLAARVAFQKLSAQHITRVAEIADAHRRDRESLLASVDQLDKRLRALELAWQEHQAAHHSL
jgi:hypothetical protein